MPKAWFTIGNDNADAICCVHGLAPLHWWTNECKINHEKSDVPTIVVAQKQLVHEFCQ
jgi:hypothetical protein